MLESSTLVTRWSLLSGAAAILVALLFSPVAAVVAKPSADPLTAETEASSAARGDVVLPRPAEPFTGTMGRTIERSTPMFPKLIKAPAGAPNILLIMTDDVGFGASSTFGGLIPTPNLDRLAAQGLRYNRFHTTSICSSTRASLLTGRNHHAVGTGTVNDSISGYPGYWGIIPKSAATVAEVLRQNGYNTAMFGKHHNVPYYQMSAAGPFDLWPTGLGFDYFYGFLGGDTNQWQPKLYRGTTPITEDRESSGPHLLDSDLAGEVLNYIHNQQAAAPDKPFFVYYAPGSTHAPHQAPKEWIAKFRGQFDGGWDKLRSDIFARQRAQGIVPSSADVTLRPKEIPAWSSLQSAQQHFYARMMEVYAAMLAYQDDQIGRVLSELDRMGINRHTLVMFIEGDNGASAEGGIEGTENELGMMVNGVRESPDWRKAAENDLGGPNTYQLLPVGWAWALDTPFQWTKQVGSHFGGTRNGLVITWPDRIKDQGAMRSQFAHVIDIMPTILEAASVPVPEVVNGVRQQHMDGVSLLYTFDAPGAPERHTTQYFEMVGNRAIYHDGWIANTTPARMPWVMGGGTVPTDQYRWELYDLRKDYSQAHDLAAKNPAKLKELQALFYQEAERNHVFPLDDRQSYERTLPALAFYTPQRKSYVYWSKNISVARDLAPPLAARSFSIIADVVIPEGGANGVLVASGSHFGGWSFYLQDGKPIAYEAFSQQQQDRLQVTASEAVKPGPAQIRYDFDYDGGGPSRGGTMRISVDGREVARGRIERTILITAGLGESFDIGRDTGAPVADYSHEAPFTGEILKVEVQPH